MAGRGHNRPFAGRVRFRTRRRSMVAPPLVENDVFLSADERTVGGASFSPLQRKTRHRWAMEPTTLSSSGRNFMSQKILVPFLAALVLASVHLAQAQQTKAYRVGVIFEGGNFSVVVDGLKDGLKGLGFDAGKQYVLEIRDL